MKKAIFLDRDGTLNEMVYDETHGLMDSPRRPGQVRMIPGAGAILAEAHKAGFHISVVTNQPGIAKGTLTVEELEAVNAELARQLAREGGGWDDLWFCPHHPKGDPENPNQWVGECACRKPKPGLLLESARQNKLDLMLSWMVGDGLNDVQAGHAAGCQTILITRLKIEQVERFFQLDNAVPKYIVLTLREAWNLIRRA